MADLIPMLMAAAGATPPGPSPRNEAIFTDTSGPISWVVPSGVTKISAVCIGGGGGGKGDGSGGGGGAGGDLRYYNNLSVTPGETLTITVGVGGTGGTSPTAGGYSRIARSGTTLLEAAGGGAGSTTSSGAKNGTSTTVGGSVGGNDGGTSTNSGGASTSSGAGGAGGYAGNGGTGASLTNTAGSTGTGGSGGGGGGGGGSSCGGSGGGVNVFGQDYNGTGGNGATGSAGNGVAGSFGDSGLGPVFRAILNNQTPKFAGGGGSGRDLTGAAGPGGQGAVRIVYPGDTRSFPSTDVWMSETITTLIETQAENTNVITIPASALAGDLAILFSGNRSSGTPTDPAGWTRMVNESSAGPTATLWYRILQSGDAGTTATVRAGTAQSLEMILFRKATGTFSSANIVGATGQRLIGTTATQTQNASTATAPFIVFGIFEADRNSIDTTFTKFTGGYAGVGNYDPTAVFAVDNGDTTREGFIRFRIYDVAPPNDVVFSNTSTSTNSALCSCILEVT
jgi:hypothetical protein